MLDYETLRIIWWLLLGILLIGFAIMDGFDLGVGMLLPFVARNDIERRITINTVGPVWEGNQVWIILGAGAIFAAWPAIYATAFSGFYLAMILALAGFIMRPVGFKYRSKINHPTWKTAFDTLLFLGGFIPTLVFGVAIGNVLQGVPFYFDDSLRMYYSGTFFQLFNPFALLCGIASVMMLAMHGGLYLSVKTEKKVRERAINYARSASVILIILYAVAGIWLAKDIHGYIITSAIVTDGPSNPLYKTVVSQTGAWMQNYAKYPITILAPALGFLGAIFAFIFAGRKSGKFAFICSAVSIFGIISSVGTAMFPFIMPSSLVPKDSLIVWDASSSQLTLFIMLIAAIIFIPLIMMYTAWVYRVMRGKVTEEFINKNEHSVY